MFKKHNIFIRIEKKATPDKAKLKKLFSLAKPKREAFCIELCKPRNDRVKDLRIFGKELSG